MILDDQYLNTGIHLLRYMMYPVPEFVNLVIFFFKEMNEWGKLILTMKKKSEKAMVLYWENICPLIDF